MENKKEKMKKDKKSRKPLPYDIKISLVSFIIIAIMFGITLPIHYYVPSFSWCWVIFVWLLIVVPIGLIKLKVFAESKNNFTEEQKKAANLTLGLAMLWFWYLDFVYMVIFNNWKTAIYIMAGFALIKILMNVVKIFISEIKKDPFIKQFMLVDFLVGVSLIVYLINLIEDTNLQTIITAVSASVLGGLLTLVGVAWTIKHTNESRKQDEVQRCIPLFSYNMLRQEPRLDVVIQKICFTKLDEDKQFNCGVYVELENSNKNSFIIRRVFHDNTWFEVEGNTTVLPSNKCLFYFNFSDKPESIFLEVEDELSNKHYYQLKVLLIGSKTSHGDILHTVREIVKVDYSCIK